MESFAYGVGWDLLVSMGGHARGLHWIQPLDQPKNSGGSMTPASLMMMIFVLTLVWGGLAVLLAVALKKEQNKSARKNPPHPHS